MVPNTSRIDKHQTDLAKYIEEQNLGLVLWNLNELPKLLSKVQNTRFEIYNPVPFFLSKQVNEIL